jgi:predicted enzyme related to lactoylglutathione lyase
MLPDRPLYPALPTADPARLRRFYEETPKTIDGIADMAVGRAAWFKDPDGNLIGMIQLNTPH